MQPELSAFPYATLGARTTIKQRVLKIPYSTFFRDPFKKDSSYDGIKS